MTDTPGSDDLSDSESLEEVISLEDDSDIVMIDGIRHRRLHPADGQLSSNGSPAYVPIVTVAPDPPRQQTTSVAQSSATPQSQRSLYTYHRHTSSSSSTSSSSRLYSRLPPSSSDVQIEGSTRRRPSSSTRPLSNAPSVDYSLDPDGIISLDWTACEHVIRCVLLVVVVIGFVYYTMRSINLEQAARKMADENLALVEMEISDPFRFVGRLFFSDKSIQSLDELGELELDRSPFLQMEEREKRFGMGSGVICSGVIIGPNEIITSEECYREAFFFDDNDLEEEEEEEEEAIEGRFMYFVPQYRLVGSSTSLLATSPKGYFEIDPSSSRLLPADNIGLLRVASPSNLLPTPSLQGKSLTDTVGSRARLLSFDRDSDASHDSLLFVGYPKAKNQEGKRMRQERIENLNLLKSSVVSGGGVFVQDSKKLRWQLCGIISTVVDDSEMGLGNDWNDGSGDNERDELDFVMWFSDDSIQTIRKWIKN